MEHSIDREKVIEALHCRALCCQCAYYKQDEKHVARCDYRGLMDDTITLLKEQEAVVPINSYGTFRCGNCRSIVGYNDGYGRGYQNNFCSKCGKAVKWDT